MITLLFMLWRDAIATIPVGEVSVSIEEQVSSTMKQIM